jgi:hypothetical protein
MKKDQKHSTVEFQTNPSKKAESSEKSGEFNSPFTKRDEFFSPEIQTLN